MNCILIFGPPAVGKMAVGMELARIRNYKLVHNHSFMEILSRLFEWGSDTFYNLDVEFYWRVCEELAKIDIPGVVLTKVRLLEKTNDNEFVEKTLDIFRNNGAEIFQVELYATLKERKRRNNTPLRLQEKASKRDLDQSEKNMLVYEDLKINSHHKPGLIDPHYLKIDSTHKSVEETAQIIIKNLNL